MLLQQITEPRLAIMDSHEACRCLPDRSNKLSGSMLYNKIQSTQAKWVLKGSYDETNSL
ncbi:hypothetical protein DPMN_186287 [Dreissena polymorpha]|uniref:Uncharacterized protein n=1 Tax=Dreissena polymorpha TaxID=45954 RepID=A0A9D4I983_DREPO|nr:hypothetical protein DPMN_186287 [Dreissena polymorpha]